MQAVLRPGATRLSDEEYRLLTARQVHNLPHDSIGRIFGIPPAAVQGRIRDALRRLALEQAETLRR